MTNIPIVCYLFTVFDEISSFSNFLNNYTKYNSGMKHKLIICFKLLEKSNIEILRNRLNNIDYEEFIDPVTKNDYDFGSYKRISEKFAENDILFLNSHSYPICNDWLKKLMNYKVDNSLIGTSGSFESLRKSIQLKKLYKFFSYFLKKIIYSVNFDDFPNPHIRTSSFLIKGKDFYDYIKNKDIKNKMDAWKIESGKKNLTNHFKNMNYDIYIINSDGKKFTEKEWMHSETYCYSKQLRSIISDKHTRKYLALSEKDKVLSQLKVWGN